MSQADGTAPQQEHAGTNGSAGTVKESPKPEHRHGTRGGRKHSRQQVPHRAALPAHACARISQLLDHQDEPLPLSCPAEFGQHAWHIAAQSLNQALPATPDQPDLRTVKVDTTGTGPAARSE